MEATWPPCPKPTVQNTSVLTCFSCCENTKKKLAVYLAVNLHPRIVNSTREPELGSILRACSLCCPEPSALLHSEKAGTPVSFAGRWYRRTDALWDRNARFAHDGRLNSRGSPPLPKSSWSFADPENDSRATGRLLSSHENNRRRRFQALGGVRRRPCPYDDLRP